MRRHPEHGVLQRVVREHLETFLAEARARGGGAGLPRFVEKELRAFLGCGVMASGFARFRCGGCAREILVAFSCKGRGFCPSWSVRVARSPTSGSNRRTAGWGQPPDHA